MPEEPIDGVKFSEFPSAVPGGSDELVGLHSGNNARFSVSNFILSIRQGLANLFVPQSRTINGKGLSSDIALTAQDVGARPDTWTPSAADVGAIPTTEKGVANGVASLDGNGQVPSSQLDLSGKQNTITASGILKGDGAGGVSAAVAGTDFQAPLTAGTDYATPAQLAGKANQAQLAYVETGTTASRAYSVGEYFCWNGLLYRAKTAISNGASFTPGTNCESVTGGGLNSIVSDYSPHLLGGTNFTAFDSTNKPTINLSDSIYNYRFISVVLVVANYEFAASTMPVTASLRHTSIRLEESNALYALALVSNLHTATAVVYNFYASTPGWSSTVEKLIRVYGIGKK